MKESNGDVTYVPCDYPIQDLNSVMLHHHCVPSILFSSAVVYCRYSAKNSTQAHQCKTYTAQEGFCKAPPMLEDLWVQRFR
jgi:hypothetical protein